MSDKITSPKDLLKLRDQTRSSLDARSGPKDIRVTVHMGTCGIAAGARDVVARLASELEAKSVDNVTIRQSGCIGLCDQEPMLTLTDKTGRNFLYVDLDEGKVREIVAEHVIKDRPVRAYIMEGEQR
jgi:NADP-reducing hydrogenase subunit HndB